MTQSSDVIVIGAGIAGASVAAELAADLSVTVLEMEDRPGFHSTGRSAATWIPGYGPDPVRALTRASGDFLKNPHDDFCATAITSPRGEMLLGLPGQDADVDNYRKVGMHDISLEDAVKRVPLLRTDAIEAVLYDGTCLDVDVDALHQAFLRRLKQRGGHVHCDSPATAISRRAGNWHVTAKGGTFEAPVLVNASGAWGDQVAELAGAQRVGLQPKRRSVAVIPPPPGADIDNWPVTASAGETFYFKPQSGMLLVSPADITPVDPHDAWADDMAIAEAIDQLMQYMDIEVTRVDHTWGGLRTFAPDGNPVVGFDPVLEGFFWLTGQGGYGIQTSPALSRTAAALIAGHDMPADIAEHGVTAEPLSPARFVR
ncbi:MAG: FAD-binding oxidoreductase [Rhizobiales bacterium]|nr:FAD-binding oxidoreductase [Hyphomicrobiales bacterium]